MPLIAPARSHFKKIHSVFDRKSIQIVLSLFLFILSFALVASAWVFPLEIEKREGTVWLHVLAMKVGINLYDHSRTVFVNMNHGPVEPVLKTFISILFPFFSASQVSRFPSLVLPLLWSGLAFLFSKRDKLLHISLALSFFLLCAATQRTALLVGRSDATALLFFIGYGFSLRKKSPLLSGTLAALTVLTSWRWAPFLVLLFFFEIEGKRIQTFFKQLISALLVFLIFLFSLFSGDLELYYKHFFGFFTKASGWGAAAATDWSRLFATLSNEIHFGFWVTLLFSIVFFLPFANPQKKSKLVLINTFSFAVAFLAFYKNHAGGGVYYFIPSIAILFFSFATLIYSSVPNTQSRVKYWLFCALVLVSVGRFHLSQAKWFINGYRSVHRFYEKLQELDRQNLVYSETSHFYKSNYRGEVIDIGDSCAGLALTGYMGETFTHTYNQSQKELKASPPEYVYSFDCCESPALLELKKSLYVQIERSPEHLFSDGWNENAKSVILKRKDRL